MIQKTIGKNQSIKKNDKNKEQTKTAQIQKQNKQSSQKNEIQNIRQKKEFSVGYKFTKSNKFSDLLLCLICNQLMIEPMRLYPCGHTFCKECVLNHNKKISQKRCFITFPECGKFYIELQPDLMATHLIDDLQVQCLNEGCPWTGPLDRYKKHHSKECKFTNGFTYWLQNMKKNAQKIAIGSQQRKKDRFIHLESNEQQNSSDRGQIVQIAQIQGFHKDDKIQQEPQNLGFQIASSDHEHKNMRQVIEVQQQKSLKPILNLTKYRVGQKSKHKQQGNKQIINVIDQQISIIKSNKAKNQLRNNKKNQNNATVILDEDNVPEDEEKLKQKYTKKIFINSYKKKFHKIIENPHNMNLTRSEPSKVIKSMYSQD